MWHKGNKGRSRPIYLEGSWKNAGGDGDILGHGGSRGDAGRGNMLYLFERYSQQLINLVSHSANIEVFDMPATAPGREA